MLDRAKYNARMRVYMQSYRKRKREELEHILAENKALTVLIMKRKPSRLKKIMVVKKAISAKPTRRNLE